jgi:putative pyruvate formate lyase activating enzyme
MTNLYSDCRLCPRNCGVNRLTGETGYCGETAALRVGAALLHNGEEPPLVTGSGSGTVFVSGCNLGCVFCQNYQISQGYSSRRDAKTQSFRENEKALGKAVTPEEFAGICVALRDKGAANINIVTGSHAIPGIVEGIIAARNAGVQLPVLWNSSAYENTQALELLRDHVDIFLPDLKTLDSGLSKKFFNAPDYPETATAAILKMLDMSIERHDGNSALREKTLREKVIIRHLILPGYLESTRSVLRWFAENVKDRALLSLMTQYTPIPDSSVEQSRVKNAPNRYLQKEECDTVMRYLKDFNIEDGFCQELVTGNDWLPDFTRRNPFSSDLSIPIWHYTNQFL